MADNNQKNDQKPQSGEPDKSHDNQKKKDQGYGGDINKQNEKPNQNR